MIRKYWIALLGAAFLMLSAFYFLRLAYGEGWLPPIALIAAGGALGLTALAGGYSLHLKGKGLFAELCAGTGAGILYGTIFYAGFSSDVGWSDTAVLTLEIALTALVVWISFRFQIRVLAFLALAAGLTTPLLVDAPGESIFVLFLYVLVLNLVSLFLSSARRWTELRAMSFTLTFMIYVIYYLEFASGPRLEPFLYALAFFVTFAAGLFVCSWRENKSFQGLNLLLAFLNGINFAFWSYLLLKGGDFSFVYPVMLVGLVYLVPAGLIHRIAPGDPMPILTYLFAGIVILAAAAPELGGSLETPGLHYVVQAFAWLAMASLLFGIGLAVRRPFMIHAGMAAWLLVFIFWYAVAWKVEWVRWFDVKYIPFINPGALFWLALAGTGFFISRRYQLLAERKSKRYYPRLSMTWSVLGHLVVGGLFTIQILNTWDAHEIAFVSVHLMLSIMWGAYAALLFLWGAYSRETAWRVIGSGVLALTAIKALTFDLMGSATVYKAGFLFVMGLIVMGIYFINAAWTEKTADS